MGRIRLSSAEATISFGKKMASLLPPNAVLALSGDLGAGKTTFVQGLALGLKIMEPVTSPTFVILNSYNDTLHHFDLYRIKDASDFAGLGFEDYFQRGICAIEWPDRIQDLLPSGTISIHFDYDGTERFAEVKS